MTPRAWAAVLAGAAILATFVPARSSEAVKRTTKPKARVGLVFDVGGRGDKSFNDAAYLGVARAEKELDIEASYLEPASTEDREAALRLFAARGFDLVIGVGFIFSSDIDAVARAVQAGEAPSRAGLYWNAACLRDIGAPRFWRREALEPIIARWRAAHPPPPPQPPPICSGP